MSGLLVLSALLFLSLSAHAHAFSDSDNSTSRKSFDMSVDDAMNQAVDALNHIKRQQSKAWTGPERSALSDCCMFYEFAIMQLNRTLNPTIKGLTFFDTQIWLSSALTNLKNCKTSITELNVTHSVFLSDNASELISNSLAINAQKNVHRNSLQNWFQDKDSTRFLQLSKNSADIVVAQDGSGDFSTINEALHSCFNRKSSARTVIHIKQGKYREYVEITSQLQNIMLVGDGMKKTIITGDRSFKAGYTTFQSATVKVIGDGFVARDITFCNTAGPEGGQAVALYSKSDHSAFYRCAFLGYQDTLCAESNRQFYQECHIYGTIDFIFGNAAVVLQNSYIYARKPIHGQSVVLTAHGRTDPHEPTGISIINCKVQAGPDLKPVLSQYKAYLGRPWKKYSRTVFVKSFLDSLIDPLGWLKWRDDESRVSTVYYAEYGNHGPGSSTEGRVKWPGYRMITDVSEAQKFGVAEFIDGQTWLPETGVPFSGGLSV